LERPAGRAEAIGGAGMRKAVDAKRCVSDSTRGTRPTDSWDSVRGACALLVEVMFVVLTPGRVALPTRAAGATHARALATATGRNQAKRADIQALRALAVVLVLVFHLQPTFLSGGYVGVDVFFVISGFLITSHLLASPPRGLADLGVFWSRRIARLLPAALVVLVATLAASRAVGPETQWGRTADDVTAAGFYVVNWRFADQAVDYLASEGAPSAVQHYWSLSVEEQFYAGWPVLLLLLFGFGAAARLGPGRQRLLVVAGLGIVTVGSLLWSIQLTTSQPARAYFVTPTRIWELGVGGLLAAATVLHGRRRDAVGGNARWRAPLAIGGFAAIAWSAVTYTGSTPFPGWHALVPVLGATGVIAASVGGSLGRVLAVRPVQFVGDVSYSIYLWHWPLIVLVPAATHRALSAGDKVGIVGATLLLAAASKRWIEDPFQRPRTAHPIRVRYVGAVAGMAALAGLAALQVREVHARELDARTTLAGAAASHEPCFGAAALADANCRGLSQPMLGSAAQAALDKSEAYPEINGRQDCFSYLPDFPSIRCEFGSSAPRATIALVGNSHAGHWLPALQELARRHDWHITTFLSSRCALASVKQQVGTAGEARACVDWVDRTTSEVVAGGFDAVVVSNRISVPVPGKTQAASLPDYERGYREVLGAWRAAGLHVLGIRDTPAPGEGSMDSVPDCLAGHDDPAACAGTPMSWLPPDPFVAAAHGMDDPDIRVVDLTDRICGPRSCDPVVGGVIVYFDASHLTATYSRTLSPYLEPAVVRAVHHPR
jgi:peptidoglycan/LPS O-acetylase OafA/YrhL